MKTTYPSSRDRRAFIEEETKAGKPSFGHLALALLMQKGLCRSVWTTNFDRTIEDAAFKAFGTSGSLVIADLGEPGKLRQAWAEQRWPIYAKLHGDYQSDRLKNVATELKKQDDEMRGSLIQACRTNGLAVVGYSGRDASVLDALRDAIDEGKGFPGGLFWFKRHQEEVYPKVSDLIASARSSGVEAHIVDTETFDELFSDLTRFLPETEKVIGPLVGSSRPRLAKILSRSRVSNTPAIRTNALPLISHPATCRLVICEIGGTSDVQDAIAAADVDVIAMRAKASVLCFGRDVDVRKVFAPFDITVFDTHAIAPNQLAAPTGARALLSSALFRALGQRPGLIPVQRGRKQFFLPNPAHVKPADFNSSDAKPIDKFSGAIGAVDWKEACSCRIDYKMNGLWLVFEPRIILDTPENASKDNIEAAREFVRERSARRRNRESNALWEGWTKLLIGEEDSIRLRTFEISDGYDADFEIARVAGFSGAGK